VTTERHLTTADHRLLKKAVRVLERDHLGLRVLDVLGSPFDAPLKLASPKLQHDIDLLLEGTVKKSFRWVDGSLAIHDPPGARGWLTQVAATSTGFVSGLFGVASLPFELPIVTFLTLRAIDEVSEDFCAIESEAERRLQCLLVLSLASRTHSFETRSSYWSVRDTYEPMVIEAARNISSSGAAIASIPAAIALVQQAVKNFWLGFTEQVALRSVPLIGGVAGSSLNFFMVTHYRKMAAAHFSILRLEAKHGHSTVRKQYMHEVPRPQDADA